MAEKQAADVVLLDIRQLSTVADYFVICTGESERQMEAITEETVTALEKVGVLLLRREGANDSGWVLLDYGEVVAHIFAPPERQFYRLERLWKAAPTLLRVQ